MAGRPLMLATLLGASIGVPYVVSHTNHGSSGAGDRHKSRRDRGKIGLAHLGFAQRIDDLAAPPAAGERGESVSCGAGCTDQLPIHLDTCGFRKSGKPAACRSRSDTTRSRKFFAST